MNQNRRCCTIGSDVGCRYNGPWRYCQLKPDLADWMCGAHTVIPDKSMDSLEANCVLRVEFSLS